MKKFLKLVSSRVLFLFLGAALVLTIYSVQAAWDKSYGDGEKLTAVGFNDVVAKLSSIDSSVSSLNSTVNSLGSRVGALESAPPPSFPGFGAWEAKSSGPYQALTDGIVIASRSYNGTWATFAIYSDASTNPSTSRAAVTDAASGVQFTITSPIKKGDWWKVAGASNVFWIPLGN